MHPVRGPQKPRFHRPLLLWLAAVSLFSCGGDDAAVERARLRLERGDLATAESVIAGVEGSAADALRQRIARAHAHRAEVDAALDRIRAEAFERPESWSRTMLQELLGGESDPEVVDRVERLQSELASARAERRRLPVKTGREDPDDFEEPAPAPTASRPGPDPLADARAALRQKQWVRALALASRAAERPELEAEIALLRASIASAARVEAEELLSRARATEGTLGPVRASAELSRELGRFPSGSEFSAFRLEADLLSARAARAGAATGRTAPPTRSAPAERAAALGRAQSPDECAALAEAYEESGELDAAQDAWLEAGRRYEDPGWREECGRSAAECGARLALRTELADFARVDPETARALGGEPSSSGAAGSADLAARVGHTPVAQLAELVLRARLSPKAELGWCVEAIVRGEESDRARALARLGDLLARGRIDPLHASKLVARAKGAVAEGGWAWRGGRWVDGAVAAREVETERAGEVAARRTGLAGEFRRATLVEREALLERLRASGDPELLAEALQARWRDDWERLQRNPNLRQFAALADARRELDRAREKALALIFDEERYFYPYNPPECPPEKAAKYAAVQREVNELVGAVRDVWENTKRVRVGDGLARELAELAWLREAARPASIELAAPSEYGFVECLPVGGDVGIAEFAWDANERAALQESGRIEARNERLWAELAAARPAPDVPGRDEAEQVRVTNAYRRMLGRRALAWNPKLQAATQGHSDYMANTGNFGHFEEGDPARRTPYDRMRLAGYERGASENCSMGRGDPRSAHEGWTQSSGHHRNLLMQGHREMASAIASSYWTQNFGVDESFRADL